MKFNVVLRDDVGVAFNTANGITLDFQLDTSDIVNVGPGPDNRTITVRALRPGEAILRVYANTHLGLLDDYVKVLSLHIAPQLIKNNIEFKPVPSGPRSKSAFPNGASWRSCHLFSFC